jgi:hypothetical protein
MANEVMRRKASDNEYLHKDFHGALSVGLDYLREHYGDDSVREYLREFALDFYAPLTNDLKQRGLVALKEYFEKLYKTEGGEISITFSPDELVLKVQACPAVMHIRKNNHAVSPLFYETTKTVNEMICQNTPFAAELVEYDQQTGRSVQRFYRRKSS